MKRLTLLIVTAVAVLAATAATAIGIASANHHDDSVRMGPGMMVPGSSSTPGWWDDSWDSMMGRGMMGGGLMGRGAASEPAYLTEMVAHHQEAITAARQLARSDRPEMRALGESIVRTQTAQIDQMKAWLADWYPNRSATTTYRPMMRDLTGLSGDRLDRVFLQDMTGHHMAAVMLSQQLLWRGTEHRQVAELARSIRDDQHTEMIQMQRWLGQWYDVGWNPGMGMWSGSGSDWDSGSGSGWGMGPGMMWGYRSGS